MTMTTTPALADSFGRSIHYLRISVTDRCDFRCIYCMAEDMQFLPRKEVLTFEEISRLSQIFVNLGVKKIRITGGEPLVRNNVLEVFNSLGKIESLDELCLTTNGSQLEKFATPLADAGVKRVNISLDTLNPIKFKKLTRFGNLQDVLNGIQKARTAGFERIKINAVLMRNYNLDEAIDLASFALENNLDISFIEEMPLGEIQSHQRSAEFISSDELKEILASKFYLTKDSFQTGGPSRYWQAQDYSSKIGFISPHSQNFCADCNRVRLTATGRLLLCLGNEDSLDLRSALRDGETDEAISERIMSSMQVKPEKHNFDLNQEPQILRFMNTTGG